MELGDAAASFGADEPPAPAAEGLRCGCEPEMADLTSQVQGFTGILQVDGYGSYKGLARRHPQIQLAFCLAHARRKFVAVYKATHAPLARDVIASLGEVYAIEARARGRGYNQHGSAPVGKADEIAPQLGSGRVGWRPSSRALRP